MKPNRPSRTLRHGSVYVAVLGTALVASTMALAALALQRVQNRQLTLSSDVRQAQLNAEAAIELGLLTIKNDDDWRSTYGDVDGAWFTRNTGNGTSSLEVADPIDNDLEDSNDEPIVLLGIGQSGNAEQRVELYVDPRQQPAAVLQEAASAGGVLVNQDTNVDWDEVLATYQSAGVQINYNALPATTSLELARNTSFNTNANYWDDDPPGLSPGLPDSDFSYATNIASHTACLLIERSDRRCGAGNELQVDRMKPNTTYRVTIEVIVPFLSANRFNLFMVTEYSDGTTIVTPGNTTQVAWTNGWTPISANITTPAWSSEPATVYIVINSDHSNGNAGSFYIDNLNVYEDTSGRALYHQVLGPTVANPNGIYWIDCAGGRLVIERTRILGTLLVLNPGANSQISNGPIHLEAATAGYPALLVKGDFAIRATNRGLNESFSGETGTNFNPAGVPFEFGNPLVSSTDSSNNDIYPSEIRGLVVVSGNLTLENSPRIRGQIIVGRALTGLPSLEHRLDSNYNPPPMFTGTPKYERRAASARKALAD